jgi:hypothetical protein
MKCEECGEVKPDAREREDPYQLEMPGPGSVGLMVLCDECAQNRADTGAMEA